MPRPLSDYAIIGDTHTSALVASDGSIDWLCWPRHDSPALFTRLLDETGGGAATLALDGLSPAGRCYAGDTNVLQTRFGGSVGTATLTDLMPLHPPLTRADTGPDGDAQSRVVRVLACDSGRVSGAFHLVVTPDYGREHAVARRDGAGWIIESPAARLSVTTSGEVSMNAAGLTVRFDLQPGEKVFLALTFPSDGIADAPLTLDQAEQTLRHTTEYWTRWSGDIRYEGAYRSAVVRSALVNYAQCAVNGFTSVNGTTVNLGNFRVGSTQAAALTIGNVAPTGAFTEKLDAAAGITTGNATLGGGINGLAAGGTSTAVSVGLNTASAGAKSGTAMVNFTSNAAGVDSLGNSALPSLVVSVNGNAFRLATGSAPTPVSVGNVHVGDTASTTLAVTNTAANDGFSEKLNAAVSGTTGAVSGTSGNVSLLAAGGVSNAITASLNTATAGAKSGTVGLNYASDGTGNTGAAASANGTVSVTVTGTVYNLASSSSIGNVNFGVLHTGTGTQSQAVSVTNTAAAGSYSEGLNTSFGAYTNNSGTIGVSSSGSVVNLAAGSTDGSSLKLSVSTAAAGQISGSIDIHQSSNGTISSLSATTLADQNPGVSGTVQATVTNLAQGQINTAQPVAFGNVRIGTSQQQALSITNAAPTSQYSESLIAKVAGTSGGGVASGGFGPPTSVPSLVAQGTDTTHVVVGIDTSSAGSKSGNATLNFKSDGTAYNGGTVTDLGNTDVAVTGNVYRLASPTVNTPSVALAARVGGTASTAISVTNSSPDSFTEGLKASAAMASPGFSNSGGIANLVAGGTDATSLKVGLNTGTAGTFSGTQTLTFASIGAGTTGAADMALAAGSVAVSGKVYAAAVASETPNPVSFGTVHVSDTATKALTVGNIATGALTDVLTGGFGTVSSKFSGTGTLGGGVAAGGTSNALTVGLDTSAAGSFAGSAALALSSHDGDLADIGVSAGPVSLSGTVNNYAVSGFGNLGSAGTFSGSGTGSTLDFGTVTQGSAGLMDMLYAGNFATSLADLLSGSFADQGSAAFSLNGFAPLSGLGAGQNIGPFSVSFGTSALGMFSEVVTLFGVGSNDSGYSGALPNVTLTLLGDVVAGTGGGGGTPVPEHGSLAAADDAIRALLVRTGFVAAPASQPSKP